MWSVITSAKQVYGDDMAAFLCWMGVRLLEVRRVLREDGSMYLHCDHAASHYLKALMDAIFGRRNFRSEIIWRRPAAPCGALRRIATQQCTVSTRIPFCFAQRTNSGPGTSSFNPMMKDTRLASVTKTPMGAHGLTTTLRQKAYRAADMSMSTRA